MTRLIVIPLMAEMIGKNNLRKCKMEEELMDGIFGDLFDFNHDGELDSFERAMEYEAFEEMMKEDESDDVDEDEELETALETGWA